MAPAGGPVAGTALSMEMKYRKQVIGTCSVYDKKALDLFGSFNFSETDKEVFLSFCLHAAKAFIRLREPEVQDQYVSEETRFIVDEGCGEE
jgi:hypothetical protein